MVHLVGEILGWMENGLEKNREKIDFMSIFSLSLPQCFLPILGGKLKKRSLQKSPLGIVQSTLCNVSFLFLFFLFCFIFSLWLSTFLLRFFFLKYLLFLFFPFVLVFFILVHTFFFSFNLLLLFYFYLIRT